MKHVTLLFAPILLTACGFSPVYKSGAAATGASIVVEEIPGRSGHVLRKALLQELAVGLPGVEDATLTVSVDEDLRRLALRPDQAASRSDVSAEGRYVLAFPDNAISGVVEVETSFNVPDATYGDIAAQIDASERAMSKLARRITNDIRIKLAAQK